MTAQAVEHARVLVISLVSIVAATAAAGKVRRLLGALLADPRLVAPRV